MPVTLKNVFIFISILIVNQAIHSPALAQENDTPRWEQDDRGLFTGSGLWKSIKGAVGFKKNSHDFTNPSELNQSVSSLINDIENLRSLDPITQKKRLEALGEVLSELGDIPMDSEIEKNVYEDYVKPLKRLSKVIVDVFGDNPRNIAHLFYIWLPKFKEKAFENDLAFIFDEASRYVPEFNTLEIRVLMETLELMISQGRLDDQNPEVERSLIKFFREIFVEHLVDETTTDGFLYLSSFSSFATNSFLTKNVFEGGLKTIRLVGNLNILQMTSYFQLLASSSEEDIRDNLKLITNNLSVFSDYSPQKDRERVAFKAPILKSFILSGERALSRTISYASSTRDYEDKWVEELYSGISNYYLLAYRFSDGAFGGDNPSFSQELKGLISNSLLYKNINQSSSGFDPEGRCSVYSEFITLAQEELSGFHQTLETLRRIDGFQFSSQQEQSPRSPQQLLGNAGAIFSFSQSLLNEDGLERFLSFTKKPESLETYWKLLGYWSLLRAGLFTSTKDSLPCNQSIDSSDFRPSISRGLLRILIAFHYRDRLSSRGFWSEQSERERLHGGSLKLGDYQHDSKGSTKSKWRKIKNEDLLLSPGIYKCLEDCVLDLSSYDSFQMGPLALLTGSLQRYTDGNGAKGSISDVRVLWNGRGSLNIDLSVPIGVYPPSDKSKHGANGPDEKLHRFKTVKDKHTEITGRKCTKRANIMEVRWDGFTPKIYWNNQCMKYRYFYRYKKATKNAAQEGKDGRQGNTGFHGGWIEWFNNRDETGPGELLFISRGGRGGTGGRAGLNGKIHKTYVYDLKHWNEPISLNRPKEITAQKGVGGVGGNGGRLFTHPLLGKHENPLHQMQISVIAPGGLPGFLGDRGAQPKKDDLKLMAPGTKGHITTDLRRHE